MAFTKLVGLVLVATLLISSTIAQSPTPAPSNGGGRRISPAPSPKKTIHSPAISPSPETSPSPPSPPLADSPSDSLAPALAPSSISDSPTEAPGPAQGGAVSNTCTVFGSVVVILTAAVLAI